MIQYPLREMRMRYGVSRKALAKAIGVSVHTVKEWELFLRTPREDNIFKIQMFFMGQKKTLDKPL
jgi:transcriptional regulator with XRE-family HTH domain